MLKLKTILLLGLVLASASGVAAEPATSEAAVAAPALPSATVPMSRQVDFTSAVNGHTYRIQVAIPVSPPPAKGFPVLYVTDGDGYFGTFAFASRLRAMSGELEPAVVVGIGYPEAEASFMTAMSRRNYDLTPTDTDEQTRQMLAKATGSKSEFAGADAFLKVIESEIKPRVAQIVSVDPDRTTLFGHSLGGLFALHTLFTHPDAFRTYLVLSPSIWWDHRVVLKNEAAFLRLVSERKTAPRIYIAVGGLEQTVAKGPLPPGMTRESLAKMLAASAMVDNARNLAGRLAAIKGAPGYAVRSKVVAGESHVSVGWATVNAFLNFAVPMAAAPAPAPSK